MIEMTFKAENWPDMVQQLRDVLGANPVTYLPEPPIENLIGSIPVEDYNAWAAGNAVLDQTADKIAAARKKPGRKKAEAVLPTQEASPEPEPEASPVVTETADGEGLEIVYEVDESVDPTPKELLELKDKVIDLLQAEYRAGKVQKVRDFLVKYGKGVKSFRQIDINDFAAMDEAIKGGALT